MTSPLAGARHALRRWRRRPGVASIVVLVLSLGIGATTAMFSIVDAVLLKPEPWPHAERLVAIHAVFPSQRSNPSYTGRWDRMPISWASWRDLQKLPVFEDVGAWYSNEQLIGDARTELAPTFFASSTLLSLLGVRPTMGRSFNGGDDEADTGTVIISHHVWTRLFGEDPDIIGKMVTVTPPGGSASVKTARRRIVGVLPEGFEFPGETPEVLLPIGYQKYNGSFGTPFFRALGRLAPGVSVSAADAAAKPLVRREESPSQRTSRVITLRTDRIGLGDRPLWLMLAGAALLLVVACSNVAGLLLSDMRTRHQETAVRLALGGTRGAILRQVTAEHLVLASVASVGGVVLANWTLPALAALAPPGLIGSHPVAVSSKIALWSIGAGIVTTLLAGVVPSAALASTLPGDALKRGGRETTQGGRWRHRIVVVTQFSIALVLLVGAGLFGETLVRLGREPLGFEPSGVAIATVARARPAPQPISAEERAKAMELRRTDITAFSLYIYGREWVKTQSLLDRLSILPGVTAVGAADVGPFMKGVARSARVRGDDRPIEEAQPVQFHSVSERYFDAMGMRVLRGRILDDVDRRERPNSIVISAELERRVFGGNGVGHKLRMDKAAYDVIGVVDNVKHRALSDDDRAVMYALLRSPDQTRQIVVRTAFDAAPLLPTLKQAIETHDDPMFVSAIAAMDGLVADTFAGERGRAMISGVYGIVALILASVGLYGLASRLVAERRREIGIRIALGAGRRDVRRLIMIDAWIIIGAGLAIGVPASIATSRLARGLLYGVAPAAPHVLGTAIVALALGAMVATVVPILRATRIDLATTLRDD